MLLQAVTAAGWFRLNGMWPARQGIALAFLGGVAADVAVLAADGGHAPEAVARHPRRVAAAGRWCCSCATTAAPTSGCPRLTATSASTVVTVLACGYLAAAVSDAGRDPVVAGAVAVAAARSCGRCRCRRRAGVAGRRAAGGGGRRRGRRAARAAWAAGSGLLLALACGVCALIGLRVASYDFPSRFVHFTAGVALPLTAAAPVVYALGRALT